jgi:hypothetical protein
MKSLGPVPQSGRLALAVLDDRAALGVRHAAPDVRRAALAGHDPPQSDAIAVTAVAVTAVAATAVRAPLHVVATEATAAIAATV